jgi:hypothetical protein
VGNYDMAALIEVVGQASAARIAGQLGPMTKRVLMMGQSVFRSEELSQLSPLKKKSMSDAVLKPHKEGGLRSGTSLLEFIASRRMKSRVSKSKNPP